MRVWLTITHKALTYTTGLVREVQPTINTPLTHGRSPTLLSSPTLRSPSTHAALTVNPRAAHLIRCQAAPLVRFRVLYVFSRCSMAVSLLFNKASCARLQVSA